MLLFSSNSKNVPLINFEDRYVNNHIYSTLRSLLVDETSGLVLFCLLYYFSFAIFSRAFLMISSSILSLLNEPYSAAIVKKTIKMHKIMLQTSTKFSVETLSDHSQSATQKKKKNTTIPKHTLMPTVTSLPSASQYP